MSEQIKRQVLQHIASGSPVSSAGRAKYRIQNSVVHVRFCSTSARASYKFNINPNTLSANYELWICGSADIYYLMPIDFLRSIYENPSAYVDHHHPEIRVVSVDTEKHSVTFATGGQSQNLECYLGAVL
jgi:hypothetical protein